MESARVFFTLTYAWTGACLLPAIWLSRDGATGITTVLRYLGGVGPLLAAIVLVYLTMGRDGRRDYWQRVIDIRRIPGRWYAVVFLAPLLVTGLTGLVDVLTGGTGIRLEAAADIIENPVSIIPFILFTLVFGPAPEELGWRGYALDRLQVRWNALISSIILGVCWAVWHLPLFFIEGSYQAGLGFGTLLFWLFMAEIVLQAIIMTWVYNNTGRSTLAAILFHFMVNLTGELFELSETGDVYKLVIWCAVVMIVVAGWGPRKLVRKPR